MDSSAFLIELHRVVIEAARFLLMVCVGMFLAYWQFTGLTLVAAVLRSRTRRHPPAYSAHTADLYPATRTDRVIAQ